MWAKDHRGADMSGLPVAGELLVVDSATVVE